MTDQQMYELNKRHFSTELLREIETLRRLWEAGSTSSYILDNGGHHELINLRRRSRPAGTSNFEVPEGGDLLMPLIIKPFPPMTVSPYQILSISKRETPIMYTGAPPQHITSEGLQRKWTDIVNNYCKRKLSKEEDKLIAIAALAREFHKRYGDCIGEYRCGLWQTFLENDLMWQVPKVNSSRGRPPSALNIPSWSWAAVSSAHYVFPSGSLSDIKEKFVTILDSVHEPESNKSRFESVVEAVVIIEGRVLDCCLKVRTKAQKMKIPEEKISEEEIPGEEMTEKGMAELLEGGILGMETLDQHMEILDEQMKSLPCSLEREHQLWVDRFEDFLQPQDHFAGDCGTLKEKMPSFCLEVTITSRGPNMEHQEFFDRCVALPDSQDYFREDGEEEASRLIVAIDHRARSEDIRGLIIRPSAEEDMHTRVGSFQYRPESPPRDWLGKRVEEHYREDVKKVGERFTLRTLVLK
jgi:hypothetical protein